MYFNSLFGSEDDENSQRCWAFIRDLCEKKFGYVLMDDDKQKIYVPGLFRSLCEQLGVQFSPSFSLDVSLAEPFQPSDVAAIDMIVQPGNVKKSRLVEDLVSAALAKDAQGIRSKWHLPGGPQREEATKMFRVAVSAAEQIYGENDLRVADVYFLFAEHLESRHTERGRYA